MSPRKKATATLSTAVIAHVEAQVAAKPEPDPIVERRQNPISEVSRVVVAGPPCALDETPAPAKCVVSRTDEGKRVRLLTPTGTVTLDENDVFYTLPHGVKVQKVSDTSYLVFRLGLDERPLFEAKSARDAVTLFLQKVA